MGSGGRRVSTKLWLGLGAFALVSAQAGSQAPADKAPRGAPAAAAPSGPSGGEGGGEGGEGGEGGIDAARASSDPVAFLVALDVVAAHYAAGRDVYRAGEAQAAGEMFAHPIAEVYTELEPVLAALGVPAFRNEMERASALALDRAPAAEVDRAADAVAAALRSAERRAPGAGATPVAQARAIAEMADRAALQHAAALREPDALGPYLDGYGLYRAAADRAGRVVPALEAAGRHEAAAAIRNVLGSLAAAYPGPTRPAAPTGTAADALLGEASRLKLLLD